jgi:hypothetical protein
MTIDNFIYKEKLHWKLSHTHEKAISSLPNRFCFRSSFQTESLVRVELRHGQWLKSGRRESISKVQTSRTTLHYWASRMWTRVVPFTSGLCKPSTRPMYGNTSFRCRVGLSIKPKQTACKRKTGKWELITSGSGLDGWLRVSTEIFLGVFFL